MYNSYMANNSEILLTDETRQLVGGDVLAFLQAQDIKPDLILSKLDFESDGFWDYLSKDNQVSALMQKIGIHKFADQNSNNIYDEDFYDEGTDINTLSPVYIRLKDVFKRESRDVDNAAAVNADGFVRLNKDLLIRLGYDDESLVTSRGEGDVHILLYPNIDSPASYFSISTGVPQDKLSPLVHNLSSRDFNTYVLFHEVGHTDPKQSDMSDSEGELNGDLHANNLYKKAFAQNITHDVNVPEVFSYARAIGIVAGPLHKKYAYSGSIDPDENIDHITHGKYGGSAEETFLNDTIFDLYSVTGEVLLSAVERFNALSSVSLSFLTTEQLEEYTRLRSSGSRSLEDLEAFMEGIEIPEDQQENYFYSLKIKSAILAANYSKDNPELVYETAKTMLANGHFDYDPAAKNLMENFVIGAERAAPEYFKIEGTPYLDYLKAIGREENLTSGLEVIPPQIVTNELGSAHTL